MSRPSAPARQRDDDEQRVLDEPEHVPLVGQLVDAVAHAVELDRQVLGIHGLAVDGDVADADDSQRLRYQGRSARARARRGGRAG